MGEKTDMIICRIQILHRFARVSALQTYKHIQLLQITIVLLENVVLSCEKLMETQLLTNYHWRSRYNITLTWLAMVLPAMAATHCKVWTQR